MPQLQLTKSIEIAAPATRVFDIVSDLGKWRPWNPWLVTDDRAQVDVAPDGKFYKWTGPRTGAGEMKITAEEPNHSVELDLTFIKPFKSKAKVRFEISDRGDGSTVSWGMDGSLPFFLFFLTGMMKTMIGMDYERGLRMLKDYVETGEVPSITKELGPSTFAGGRYLGITTEAPMSDMGEAMTRDFSRIKAHLERKGIEASGPAFSIYKKWKLSQARAVYTAGVIVPDGADLGELDLEVGTVPRIDTFALEHIGPFRHLGNAWAIGMLMARNREFSQSRKHKPFEVYPLGAGGRLPDGTSEATTETTLHFPLA